MKADKWMLVILLLLTIGQFAQAKVDKLRIMWRDDPATTMVIGWNQISGSAPEVCFGDVDGGSNTDFYPNCAQPARSVFFKGLNNYFVRLEHLQPATEYFFVIIDSEGTSRRYSFITAPADPYSRLSIIAGGDSRNYRNARQRANQMVAKLRPDFVMFGGDMTGGDTDKEWKQWLDDWQLTITEDGHITPIVATRGNHEYSNKTIVDIFDVPSKNVYYNLRFGGNLLEIYTLNSLIASGGNQKIWLEEQLSLAQNVQWRMAQYHYAIRPHTGRKTERNDQLSNWAKLFYQHNMNLVVESDAHVVKTTWPISPSRAAGSEEGFIRDDEKGTVYIGEGCWGAPLRKNNDDKSWTRNSGSFNQFKWIFVGQEGIEVRTIKTDNVSQVAAVWKEDRFTPPAGIEIWNPSNGPVLNIPNRSVYAQHSDFKSPMQESNPIKIIEPTALIESDGVRLEWNTENKNQMVNSFLVQRVFKDSRKIETLAKVEGTSSDQASFSILDVTDPGSLQDMHYRLVCSSPGQKSIIAEFSPAVTSNSFSNSEDQPKTENELKSIISDESISPDMQSGYLRVKYSLGKKSDVSIRLVRESNEVTSSKYQNQREGNYLKSIDMSDLPKGNYQLIIKVDEKVLHEYVVKK